MSCGFCGGGGGGYTPPTMGVQSFTTQNQITYDSSCPYTLDQLLFWKQKLKCVQNNNWAPLIGSNTAQINVYLGWIDSAINIYSKSPCYFQAYLATIVPVINLVLTNTSC